jgi:hypothetical protein
MRRGHDTQEAPTIIVEVVTVSKEEMSTEQSGKPLMG